MGAGINDKPYTPVFKKSRDILSLERRNNAWFARNVTKNLKFKIFMLQSSGYYVV